MPDPERETQTGPEIEPPDSAAPPPRVIHFHFGSDGGAERFFVKLANGLAERGVPQHAFLRPGRPWRAAVEPAVTVHEGVYRRYTIARFLMRRRLARLTAEFRPDVMIAWMTRAARMMPDVPGVLRIARLGDYPSHLGYFRNIDVIVCLTPDMARHVRGLGWTRGIEVIGNFADPLGPGRASRAANDTPDDAFVVAAGGRFVRRKGFHILIDAVARVEGVHLWLYGDGDEAEALRAQAAASGVGERIRFLGWQADPGPVLRAADVLAMPSDHEPLGNTVLEGWATGATVIAAKSEGPLWQITDDEDGLLFDIDDVAGLARILERLRDEPQTRARLAAAGTATLERRFSKRAILDEYVALFRKSRAEAIVPDRTSSGGS
jgi:Glycosyltransferase